MMRPGEVKTRLAAVEEEVGARPTRIMVVSRPPTAAQLEHQAKLEAEGFRVLFVGNPYRTPQEPNP